MLNTIKTELTALLLLSRDALHIHFGLGLYFLAVLVFKRGFASPIPWLVVLAFELVNEGLDAYHDFEVVGAVRDILNTMLWPTIALLVGRWLVRKQKVRLEEHLQVRPERPAN